MAAHKLDKLSTCLHFGSTVPGQVKAYHPVCFSEVETNAATFQTKRKSNDESRLRGRRRATHLIMRIFGPLGFLKCLIVSSRMVRDIFPSYRSVSILLRSKSSTITAYDEIRDHEVGDFGGTDYRSLTSIDCNR
jgi:hypothetical protein